MEAPTPATRYSADAAVVLALGETAVAFCGSVEGEAERWLRVLRLHGQVGSALQALGVGEAPLASRAEPPEVRARWRRDAGGHPERLVAQRASQLMQHRGGQVTGTVDVLFAVLDLCGVAFDEALRRHGTTRGELLDRLRARSRSSLAR